MEGIIVASITPRLEGEARPDLQGWEPLVELYESYGVAGIVVFGTTGEFPHYSPKDKVESALHVSRLTKLPVLCNVGDSCFDNSLWMARQLAAHLAGIVLLPPVFFKYSQADLYEYYMAFAARMQASAPLYLYNIPQFTGALDAVTAVRLLDTGHFAGVKDSSGDPEWLRTVMQRGAGRVYLGADHLMAEFRAKGASGAVSGVASAVPELMVALDEAALVGNESRVAQLQPLLEQFLRRFGSYPTPMWIRAAARWRGIRTGPDAIPISKEREAELRADREWFEGWLSQVAAVTRDKGARHAAGQ